MGTSGFIKRGWGGGVTDVFTWDWVRGTVCSRTAYASLTPASGGAALSMGSDIPGQLNARVPSVGPAAW